MFRSEIYRPGGEQTAALNAHYQDLHHAAFPGFVKPGTSPNSSAMSMTCSPSAVGAIS